MTQMIQSNLEYIGITATFSCPRCPAGNMTIKKSALITEDRDVFEQSLTRGAVPVDLKCSQGHEVHTVPKIDFEYQDSLESLRDRGFIPEIKL